MVDSSAKVQSEVGMELKATRCEIQDGVATIWLHRPTRHNAWTGRMHEEYRYLLATLADNETIRAVVVTGTPPAFCVGGDAVALASHAKRGQYDPGLPAELAMPGYGVRPEFDHDFAFQFGLPYVIIAAVNGAAAGIGLAIALFADLRFIAKSAKVTTAAARLGLPAEYGMSWILPRLIGMTRANDLLLSGRVVTGEDTAAWGLWNEVLSSGEDTLAAAHSYARMLAKSVGPTALKTTKRQNYTDMLRHDVGAALEDASRLLEEAMTTPEYSEGIAAFVERREPNF